MKIAFDLDGTLNRYPSSIGVMMHELHNAGHYCIVLTAVETGETRERRLAMLRAVGIMPNSFDELVMHEDCGGGKGPYCRDHGVDLMIDDAVSNLENIRKLSPKTACLRVMP